MEALRDTDNTQTIKHGPNPGLLRPPIIFLGSILVGIALNWAWPFHFMPRNVGLLGPLVAVCAVALPASLSGVSGRRHFRTRKHAFHHHCANGSLPVQPQSHLSGFHPLRARIVRLVE